MGIQERINRYRANRPTKPGPTGAPETQEHQLTVEDWEIIANGLVDPLDLLGDEMMDVVIFSFPPRTTPTHWG